MSLFQDYWCYPEPFAIPHEFSDSYFFFISAIKVSWLVFTVTLTQLTVTPEEAVSNEGLPRLDWPVTVSVVGLS